MEKFSRVRILAFFLVLIAMPSWANLPPEHEAARLLLSVESLVVEGKWDEAERQLVKMGNLDVELPADFFFYHGTVLAKLERANEAQQSLEKYVVLAGSEGGYYSEALARLTDIERRSAVLPKTEPKSVKNLPALTGGGDGYIKSLQALYLTDDPIKALVLQVNSLLSAHPYTGKRVKTTKQREGVLYALSVNGTNLVLQEKSFENQQPMLKVDKLNVLGVDPFLTNACSGAEYMCWVYHPSNTHDRWIKIERDDLVISELTDALTKLIRLLQKGA